jgi:murein DD-endopeptidase MepM/ murein hydrolase activator NlpD
MARRHQPRSYWRFLLPLLAVILYLGGGCRNLREGLGQWVDRAFGEATPRQQFIWSNALPEQKLAEWQRSYQQALTESLSVALPHRERFLADTTVMHSAHGLRFVLPAGRRIEIQADGIPTLFGELYRTKNGTTDLIESWDTLEPRIGYEATRRDGDSLLLVVQSVPRDYGTATFDLTLRSFPSLLFPVAGKDRRAIRSFWGDPREGGRRRHEGNDIFAERGTPVLAVADGRVGRVREGGLGGKTIWLRDESRGLSYYYAHLSEQLASSGQRVARGDTIGLVGNTGNARTTPPHLHFGIYSGGARDPLPYLLPADGSPTGPREQPGRVASVPETGRHYLRDSAEGGENVIRQLEGGERIFDLSTTSRFHRIRTVRGETGYVNFD